MDLFKSFRRTPAMHAIEAQAPVFSKIAANGRLRHGMWVLVDNQVGILTALGSDGRAEIMLVEKDGTNKIAVLAQAAQVHQAKHEDIPRSRRPTKEAALAKGYRSRGPH